MEAEGRGGLVSAVIGVVDEASARDAVFRLLGVDGELGTLAYWRSHVLDAAVKSVRRDLEAAAGGELEQWWPAASGADRQAVIDQVDVPDVVVELRPWVLPRVQWGTRVPFVPLAAFLHAMATGSHKTVDATAGAYGIAAGTTPWELLESLDDHIADAPVPDDLPSLASGVRLAFHDQPEDETTIYNPARWLLELHSAATWDVLAAVASDAVAKDRARREQLAADRAAKKAGKGT